LTSADLRREVFWDLLRLPRLASSRRVRFTNRFTDRVPVPESHRPLAEVADYSGPLRPELAAPLGVRSSSQLARCADGRAGWRLSGSVAVHDCCTAPAASAHTPGAVPTRRRSVFRPDTGQVSAATRRCRTVPVVAKVSRWLPRLLSVGCALWGFGLTIVCHYGGDAASPAG
jgi:hypothetical protein